MSRAPPAAGGVGCGGPGWRLMGWDLALQVEPISLGSEGGAGGRSGPMLLKGRGGVGRAELVQGDAGGFLVGTGWTHGEAPGAAGSRAGEPPGVCVPGYVQLPAVPSVRSPWSPLEDSPRPTPSPRRRAGVGPMMSRDVGGICRAPGDCQSSFHPRGTHSGCFV